MNLGAFLGRTQTCPIVLVSTSVHVLKRGHHLHIHIVEGLQLAIIFVLAGHLKAIAQHASVLASLTGNERIGPFVKRQRVALIIVVDSVVGKARQLEVVPQLIALLCLTHSQFDLLLLLGSRTLLLVGHEKVVKRISYLLQLSLLRRLLIQTMLLSFHGELCLVLLLLVNLARESCFCSGCRV